MDSIANFPFGLAPQKKTPTSHKNYITCGENIVFSSLVGCLFGGLAQIENCQNLHPSFLVCNGLQDVNSPLGFLRHLVSVMRMEPGGLLSAAVVCGSWTLINRYLAKWCIWDWTLKKTEVGMEDNSQTFLFAAFFFDPSTHPHLVTRWFFFCKPAKVEHRAGAKAIQWDERDLAGFTLWNLGLQAGPLPT